MPQNPLDFLKAQTLKNVPASQPGQREMWDAEAAAKQANDPTWKKIGRNAIDALTSVFDDPFAEGAANASPGAKIGMMAAALPAMPKKLPIISPEAYNDVKAGGLRLYSRLTDAFGKAPKVMNPDKIRSVAAQGASKEEISYRKLEDLLKGRQPMDKIAREDVMAHLAANPIELDVVRKGAGNTQPANPGAIAALEAQNRFVHDLDTRYGNNWVTTYQAEAGNFTDRPVITPEESDELIRIEREMTNYSPEMLEDHPEVRYDWLQTPGPKENYSETLINLPSRLTKAEIEHIDDTSGTAQELVNRVGPDTFMSSHWDEPNNLVFSRANDRRLNPSGPGPDRVYEDSTGLPMRDETVIGGSKGHFVEEIQSDWHQQGRERGYQNHPEAKYDLKNAKPQTYVDDDGNLVPWRYKHEGNPEGKQEWGFPYLNGTGGTSAYGETFEEALENLRLFDNQYGDVVPDAPYKDTYHELALKQQLLDTANDPDAEWFGIADAETNARMEGHGATPREGTRLWYDEKHPSALEKLLRPFGGEVEHGNLPGGNITLQPNQRDVGPAGRDNYGNASKTVTAGEFGPAIASSNPYGIPGTTVPNDQALFEILSRDQRNGRQFPGQGMWKSKLTPEMKAAIKERGFPAMMALLALQRSNVFGGDEQ